MLSNNRWFGAHARTWNHGGTVAPMASCHPLWLRTVVAAAMPKTAAVPAGYGITSHAPPQEAGAWSSYRLARFDVSATADGDGGYVSAASANFDASATAAAEGHGLTTLAANFDFDATAAAAAEAIFACSANFDFVATAAMDATAPWEGSANFDFAASAAAAAEAAWEGSASFDFAASASGAAGYVSAASASFDFAADWLNPVGHGVWAGTTEPDDEVLTVDDIAAVATAVLAAMRSELAVELATLRNKQITNPSTGKMIVYDDDGVTVLAEGDLFEDAAGTQPYRGQGAERRERLA